MSSRSNLVNLDAMIKRADFAAQEGEKTSYDKIPSISVRDFTPGGFIGSSLRKPDFQRETNHWTPDQVVSLLECFVSGDLIPSVILWNSPSYLFVIDGGHRLSVIKAWIEDDYGDGSISFEYFGHEISDEQKKTAKKTRKLVDEKIGSWKDIQKKLDDGNPVLKDGVQLNTIKTRGLPIQWVEGDADKAENSFFKINTKGTSLDPIEELLLRSRKKPISIAARAIIRAGKGHKYWSSFSNLDEIESISHEFHSILFDPEIKRPVKTLDLPLGGAKGVRTALKLLIDFILFANRNQDGDPKDVYGHADDLTGELTIEVLNKSLKLAQRITGNNRGSLGLHPAVYFYGPSGKHSSAMFMGTVLLIAKKISNNDRKFFRNFSSVRSKVESTLVIHKELIATMLQKHMSSKRVNSYSVLIDKIIKRLLEGKEITESDLVKFSDLQGKIIIGESINSNQSFSDANKSKTFIRTALTSAIKCPICDGYIDTEKSVSYDHIVRVRDDGKGDSENCQLTHPYCNDGIKS